MHKHQKRLSLAADIALAAALIIVFFIGITLGFKLAPEPIQEIIYKSADEKVAVLSLPAVKESGEGVLTTLTTRIKPGDGQVLVNIGDVISGYELQISARRAVNVVQNISKLSFNDLDVTFSIETDASIIDGQSASAAMAVSVLSLIENKTLNPKVTMTGAIDEGGKIRSVGMVESKAIAAKRQNMELFLVPSGQGKDIEQVEKINCQSGDIEFCEVDYMPKITLTDFGGMQIKEVIDLEEAIKWFETGGLEKYKSELTIPANEKEKPKDASGSIEQLQDAGFSLDDYTLMDVEVAGDLMALRKDCTIIPIGSSSAQVDSLIQGIHNSIINRPNSHDLIKTTFDIYDIDVIGVLVNDFTDNTYFSKLVLMQDNKILSLDSDPSDAIAIASRFYAPVFIKNEVLSSQGQDIC